MYNFDKNRTWRKLIFVLSLWISGAEIAAAMTVRWFPSAFRIDLLPAFIGITLSLLFLHTLLLYAGARIVCVVLDKTVNRMTGSSCAFAVTAAMLTALFATVGAVDDLIQGVVIFVVLTIFLMILYWKLLDDRESTNNSRRLLTFLTCLIVPAIITGAAYVSMTGGETIRRLQPDDILNDLATMLYYMILLSLPMWAMILFSSWFRGISMTKKAVVIAVLVLVSLISLIPAGLAMNRAQADGESIAILLIDTMRQDSLGCYGNQSARTPNLDRMSRQALLFSDATTPIPKTQQSVASLFSGHLPTTNGVRDLFTPLPKRETTLAELARSRGYETIAFVHNAWLVRGLGLEQGFRFFIDWLSLERQKNAGIVGELRLWRLFTGALSDQSLDVFQTDAKYCINRASKWISRHDSSAFFLYVHLFDPHWPYDPPEPFKKLFQTDYTGPFTVNDRITGERTRGDMIFHNTMPPGERELARSFYAGEIAYSDYQIKRLLISLQKWSDRFSKPLSIYCLADHGESLGEHDYYFHHGEFTYQSCLQIPLILKRLHSPDTHKGITTKPALITDLMSTVSSTLVCEVPPPIEGESLDNMIVNNENRVRYAESDVSMFPENTRHPLKTIAGKWRSCRENQWKLIAIPDNDTFSFELYDLNQDPGEKSNRAIEKTVLVDQLRNRLETWWKQELHDKKHSQTTSDELDRLRSLGYVN